VRRLRKAHSLQSSIGSAKDRLMNILHAVLHHLRYCVVQVPLADDCKALKLVDHGDRRKLSIFTDGWSEDFHSSSAVLPLIE